MIHASRFLAESTDRDMWLEARRGGVTATEVAKASTPTGLREALEQRANPVEQLDNDYMRFGRDNEGWISAYIKREFDVMPNRWLIASADNPKHMATPDGLSLDHRRMSEVKTGGTEPKSPPLMHMRQMGWQFRCNEFAEEIVYAFMLRLNINGVMVPAWIEPKTWIIRRDDALIADLMVTADKLERQPA